MTRSRTHSFSPSILRAVDPSTISSVLLTFTTPHPHSCSKQRIWSKPALGLIRIHPDDVESIHIADLKHKYGLFGLDIVEMRAIFYVIADSLGANSPEKREWSASLRNQLEVLTKQEANGDLPPARRRHGVYAAAHGVFDPALPSVRLAIVKSAIGQPTEQAVLEDGAPTLKERRVALSDAFAAKEPPPADASQTRPPTGPSRSIGECLGSQSTTLALKCACVQPRLTIDLQRATTDARTWPPFEYISHAAVVPHCCPPHRLATPKM